MKLVFLGCENSHANTFLDMLREDPACQDIEVLGVYSDEKEAAELLGTKYGVPVLEHYADCVNQADGVVITARHGKRHYEYAKPYIAKGCPMFIDKPITTDVSEVQEFRHALKMSNVRICGGSCLIYDDNVQTLKMEHIQEIDGVTLGGLVSAPIIPKSVYGGFYFYAQHLTEMVGEIFGRYPQSVKAYEKPGAYTVVFRYAAFDVTGVFVEGGSYYSARITKKGVKGMQSQVNAANPCFRREFEEMIRIMRSGEQEISYEDFFAPVFVMDAIVRSIESGKEENIEYV